VYSWTCPWCHDAVLVYQYYCGSWVIFDKLGDGRPQHSCFTSEYKARVETIMPIVTAGKAPAIFKPFAAFKISSEGTQS
jgi:hypothetical protein